MRVLLVEVVFLMEIIVRNVYLLAYKKEVV